MNFIAGKFLLLVNCFAITHFFLFSYPPPHKRKMSLVRKTMHASEVGERAKVIANYSVVPY